MIEYFFNSRKVNVGSSPPTLEDLNDPANDNYGPRYIRTTGETFSQKDDLDNPSKKMADDIS